MAEFSGASLANQLTKTAKEFDKIKEQSKKAVETHHPQSKGAK